MDGLTTKVLGKKGCNAEIEIEVAISEVNKARELAFEKIQKQAEVKGFRKGKAPIEVVKTKFKANAEHEMLQIIVPQAISDALKKEDIKALFYPEVKKLDFNESGNLKFNIEVELAPIFEVKDYKKLEIKEKQGKVSAKDIEDYILHFAERGATMAIDEDGVVKEDSFVAIDYEGKMDGKIFEGGSEKNRLLSIKNSGFIDGFADGLVGLKLGEEKDLNLTFPKDYHAKDLAGKPVIFSVKVLEIKKKVLPEINDEFVKPLGAENLEDFKKKVKEMLKHEKTQQARRETEDAVIDELIKKNPIEVPKTMVENEAMKMAENMKKQYSYYGIKDFDTTPLMDKFNKDAKRQVQAYYILNAIVDKEKIEVKDEDIAKKMQENIDKNPNSEKQIKEFFEDKKNKSNITADILHEKLFEILLDNTKKEK